MSSIVKDPVCGMELEKEKAQESNHDGKDYYFCCFHCKAEFEKEPIKYTDDQKSGCCWYRNCIPIPFYYSNK